MVSIPQDAVVLITSADESNSRFGTGFVIHLEDGATFLLTCAHVVGDVGGKDQVRVGAYLAEVVAEDKGLDVAVLRVNERLDKYPLELQTTATADSLFTTIGFRKLKEQYQAKPLEGRLGKQGNIYSREVLAGHKSWDLNINDVDTLQPGYSGSPVVDEKGVCIGIVSHREGRGEKGIAISIEVLTKIWLARPTHILPTAQPVLTKAVLANDKLRMNRDKELEAFHDIAAGRDGQTKLLVLYGSGGMGKTRLLDEYAHIAKQYELKVLRITLAEQVFIEGFLNQIVDCYPREHFARYDEHIASYRPETRRQEEEWYRILTHKFFQDLRQYRAGSQLVILIDKYEAADRLLREWLDNVFLSSISPAGTLVVVAAGREEAARDLKERLGQRRFYLTGLSKHHFREYAEARSVQVEPNVIDALHQVLDGAPLAIVTYVEPRVPRRVTP